MIGKYDDNDFQASRSTADCETARKEAEIANKETRKKVSGHKSPIENKSARHWKERLKSVEHFCTLIKLSNDLNMTKIQDNLKDFLQLPLKTNLT